MTAPFKSGILGGGFVRNGKVVPYLIHLLRNYYDEIIMYVPADTIRAGAKALASNLNISLEDAYDNIYKKLKDFIIRNNVSKLSLEIIDLIISQTLSYDRKLYSSSKLTKILYSKIWGFGHFYILRRLDSKRSRRS